MPQRRWLGLVGLLCLAVGCAWLRPFEDAESGRDADDGVTAAERAKALRRSAMGVQTACRHRAMTISILRC
jgi:hypothetical protein